MKKKFYSILSLTLIVSLTGCSIAKPTTALRDATSQKELNRIARYESAIPKNYSFYDYEATALKLDQLMFDQTAEGTYLPLIWEDNTYKSFGIPAYVGDQRMHKDGAQEAVTAIAAVLSATQLGVDKSSQDGRNYVSMLSAFYSEKEKIVLNNPSGNSETTSMWYLLYPAILFTQVSVLYPNETEIRDQALTCIDSWYQAYQIMKESGSFDYTGFNFSTMQPYKNDIWTEPDCAAGIALLLYYGYELTGKEEYLEAAIDATAYLNTYFGSPLYEALLYFAPYLAAMFNANYGTSIDVEDILDDVMNGNSIPRGGWGSIVGDWGDYSMNGLMGSTTDGGGYAFAMNTFTAAYAISPLVKYDAKYASTLGKWYLNLVSNSRYFFADQTNKENQSTNLYEKAREFNQVAKSIVPYEGIRKSSNSKTPWFGGDPTVYGWAETDFSLYSAAHVGLLGALIEPTNVEAILRINLTTADLFHREYPAYLMYNPHDTKQTVSYVVTSNGSVDLYDNVTKQYLAKGVSGNVELTIDAKDSVVIVEIPSGETVTKENNAYKVNGEVIGSDYMTVSITNLENLSKVTKKFTIKAECLSTIKDDEVKEVKVTINNEERTVKSLDDLTFSVDDLGTGSKNFVIEVIMNSGLTDKTEIRLILE